MTMMMSVVLLWWYGYFGEAKFEGFLVSGRRKGVVEGDEMQISFGFRSLAEHNYEYHVISWRSWKGSIWSIASVPTTVIYIRRVLTGSIYQTPGPSPWLCNYDSVSIVLDIYIIGAVSIYHVTKKWPPPCGSSSFAPGTFAPPP